MNVKLYFVTTIDYNRELPIQKEVEIMASTGGFLMLTAVTANLSIRLRDRDQVQVWCILMSHSFPQLSCQCFDISSSFVCILRYHRSKADLRGAWVFQATTPVCCTTWSSTTAQHLNCKHTNHFRFSSPIPYSSRWEDQFISELFPKYSNLRRCLGG